ncbi:MAG: hypothetical protein JWQ55_1287, partial [Rhodopila sp.]|nr:hypothetical protein [Rhodopila sp.]
MHWVRRHTDPGGPGKLSLTPSLRER